MVSASCRLTWAISEIGRNEASAKRISSGKVVAASWWPATSQAPVTATARPPSPVAISEHAPHPAAARLLVDFLLSTEGQRAIRSRGRMAARSDVGGKPVGAATVHYIDARLAGEFGEYEAELRRLLAPAR